MRARRRRQWRSVRRWPRQRGIDLGERRVAQPLHRFQPLRGLAKGSQPFERSHQVGTLLTDPGESCKNPLPRLQVDLLARTVRVDGLDEPQDRGRNAPTMSRKDAATLICAILGSDAVQDSVKTVEWMRDLKPEFHGYRFKRPHGRFWRIADVEVGIRPNHDVIEALARVLEFFDREAEYKMAFESYGPANPDIYFRFYVEFPQRFVSLTFGVRRVVSAAWTYGRRLRVPDKQARWTEQDELREIAAISRPPNSIGRESND